jgi:hypothetical protein
MSTTYKRANLAGKSNLDRPVHVYLSNDSDPFVLLTPCFDFPLGTKQILPPPPKTRAAEATVVVLRAAPKDGAAAAFEVDPWLKMGSGRPGPGLGPGPVASRPISGATGRPIPR